MASRIQDFVANSVHGEINLINVYVVFCKILQIFYFQFSFHQCKSYIFTIIKVYVPSYIASTNCLEDS